MADHIASHAEKLGLDIKYKTVLVEGTTDVALINKAARLELSRSGIDLLDGLSFIAAGEKDRGGVSGVVRELIVYRGMSRSCLNANGRPLYRFIGLLDNDDAGRRALKLAHTLDSSILEYKDLFRLRPVMPLPGNLDPGSVAGTFKRSNELYERLDWELEDLVSKDLFELLEAEHGAVIKSRDVAEGMTHYELTRDGKAKLHMIAREHAVYSDLTSVIDLLHAVRSYFNLPALRQT